MSAENQELVQAADGIYAPQHYNAVTGKYEHARGVDGAAYVAIQTPQKELTFANAATDVGSSSYAGDIAERSITVEFFGSTGGVTATFTAWAVRGSRKYPIQGVKVAGGEIDLVGVGSESDELIKPGMIVSFTKPAGSDFEIQWTKPTGGTVSAVGTVI